MRQLVGIASHQLEDAGSEGALRIVAEVRLQHGAALAIVLQGKEALALPNLCCQVVREENPPVGLGEVVSQIDVRREALDEARPI